MPEIGLVSTEREPMIAATASTSITPSGLNNLMLCGAGPSTTKPITRTMIAVVTTVSTRPTPAVSQRLKTKQISVKIASPNGNAPEPTRVVVDPSAEPRLTTISAE